MEQAQQVVERRKYPRYLPDRKNQPRVNFIMANGDKVPIEVMNISGGGMFGYTSNIAQLSEIEQNIDKVEIIFPNNRPLCCSGKLLRLQPTRKKSKCFCAVEFAVNGVDENQNQVDLAREIERALLPDKKTIIPDQHFINRVKNTENYIKIENLDWKSSVRRTVYDSFDDITNQLSWEEKWWFFEILDAMKRYEPDYPEDLCQAFIQLCRTGLEQSIKKNKSLAF